MLSAGLVALLAACLLLRPAARAAKPGARLGTVRQQVHQLFLNVLQQLDRARRGIILFHDIHEQTVIVLPHLLEELRARGFKTVVFVPQGSVKYRD